MKTHSTEKPRNNQQERRKDVKGIGLWPPKHPTKKSQDTKDQGK